ncbi:hypothetical protein [Streptomyces sp. NPDC047718]|uniref:hypothetical protein n=1 Tax=Streptomyces sp. NPDC047718 TaxID=3155479 RepID=UPI0033CBA3FE
MAQKVGGYVAVGGSVAAVVGAGVLPWNWADGTPWTAWPLVLLGAGLVTALVGLRLRPGLDRWADALAAGGLTVLVLAGVVATGGTVEQVRLRGRTTEPVTIELSGCRVTGQHWDEGAGPEDEVECRYVWSVGGRTFDEVRPADKVHPDGHRIRLWASPEGGELDEHSWQTVAAMGLSATVVDGLVLLAGAGAWRRVSRRRAERAGVAAEPVLTAGRAGTGRDR